MHDAHDSYVKRAARCRDIEALWRTFVAQQESFAVTREDLIKLMAVLKDAVGGEASRRHPYSSLLLLTSSVVVSGVWRSRDLCPPASAALPAGVQAATRPSPTRSAPRPPMPSSSTGPHTITMYVLPVATSSSALHAAAASLQRRRPGRLTPLMLPAAVMMPCVQEATQSKYVDMMEIIMAFLFTAKMPIEDKVNFLFDCMDFDGKAARTCA